MTREIIRQIERDYWAEKADPIDMSEIFDLAQKALEQEPCEDAISRQAMLDYQQYLHGKMSNEENHKLWEFIKGLPPVIPTRKVGKWIFTKTIFDKYGCTAECPSCHKKWKTYDEIRWKKENKFCPNCGTEMESE